MRAELRTGAIGGDTGVQGPGRSSAGAGRAHRVVALLSRGPGHVCSSGVRWAVSGLALVGAGLIVASAVIHLHLWASGYRHIRTIGPLFVVQGVVSIALASALAVFRRLGLMLSGAALMVGSALGLLLSSRVRLFGYQENLAVPYAGMSLIIEFAAAAVLVAAAVVIFVRQRSCRETCGRVT